MAAIAPVTGAPAPGVPAPAPPKGPDRSDFMSKIVAALESAVTLRITTVVGPVTLKNINDFDAKTEFALPDGQATECAATSINLIAGDVTEVRTAKFVEDPVYAKLHSDNVETARGVIASNIATLKDALVGLEKILWKG